MTSDWTERPNKYIKFWLSTISYHHLTKTFTLVWVKEFALLGSLARVVWYLWAMLENTYFGTHGNARKHIFWYPWQC